MAQRRTLDAHLKTKELLVAPGVFDALSARIAARAGAKVLYMSGFGVVGASFGVPDVGLIGPEQMSERVRAIASATAPVPLIADGDNGHGGPANVARLVRAYEQAGAQCIQLEDQVMPKRCGHMEGKEVMPLADAVANIRAAVASRQTAAFKIMARTDARATDGLGAALRRAEAYLHAGADILFIEAPESEPELRQMAQNFAGVPLVANMVEGGKTPYLSVQALREMGFRIVLYPISALLTVARRLERLYADLLAGTAVQPPSEQLGFSEYNALVGLPELLAFDEQKR